MSSSSLSLIVDGLVKSLEKEVLVIPAKPVPECLNPGAGIQSFQVVTKPLDSCLRRNDDFLRSHHDYMTTNKGTGFTEQSQAFPASVKCR